MSTKHTLIPNTHENSGDKITELELKIIDLTAEIVTLRAELFTKRDEIHTMRSSRVLGKIIKARDVIGSPYTLVKRSANKTRRTVAKYIPDSIRLPLMKSLRKTRDDVKQGMNRYKNSVIHIVEVDNDVWEKITPLVSVVIPYYNRGDTIDDTLESLNSQTYRDFEVIIVDDGSPHEESIKKLKTIKNAGYDARFIYQQNQGVAATRNNGIKEARGKYIVCLDSDDVLEPTYIEKAVTVLETNPEFSVVSSYMNIFGIINEPFEHVDFDPLVIYTDNMIITAAMFTKKGWLTVGGYKSGIGYEDWEFWLNLTEHGFWAKQIKESLFRYRTSMQSRYIEDKDIHWNNLKLIRSLHPNYKNNIRSLLKTRQQRHEIINPATALINLGNAHTVIPTSKANILITIPWMTFGGAETLIYNFCREIKDDYNITFVTGLTSINEWEYKFKEITENIYHLPNLFASEVLYLDYVSYQIIQKNIDTLHIIHNGFTFGMLEELKVRHPHLRVILTLFNDRAVYFEQSLGFEPFIDVYTSDNGFVIDHFKRELKSAKDLRVIPNGINSATEFNPTEHDRKKTREDLGLAINDVAIFYVGRLSEEKNPNIFLDAAKETLAIKAIGKNTKFIVIGDGGMKDDIVKQIDAIGSVQIQYLGYQSAIAHYLSAADIFVLPSSIEGFPLSLLEAMAMKVAVIASRVGGVPDIIKDGTNGFMVTPGSAKEIVEVIKKVSLDKALLTKVKNTSRMTVEAHYSNILLGNNYKKLYGGH